MNDKIIYELFAEVSAYTDPDAYASDLALSNASWGADPEAEISDEELQRRFTLCRKVWGLANLSIKEIRKSTGLSQAAFAARFLIPVRSIENWESGERACPPYVRIMLARLCGFGAGIWA